MFNTKYKLGGFTLMELLIYAGISAVVGSLTVGTLITVTRVNQNASASAEVSGQMNFVTQRLQQLVSESSNIDIDAGITTSSVKLRMEDSGKDPTCISLVNGVIKLAEGSGSPDANGCNSTTSDLTSSKVVVNTLNFKKMVSYPGHDTLSLDMTMAYNASSTGAQVSLSLSSAIGRVSAATFDANVLPGSSSYTLGQSASPWQNVFVGDGSAASPAYTFANNTGVGLFRAGENILGFSTAGAEVMRIDASGVVSMNSFKLGTSTTSGYVLTANSSGVGAWAAAGGGSQLIRSTRTSNTILAAGDNSKLIDITGGTFTQTFTAAATLGSGWFAYIRNSGTGDITLDPNSSETIDGLTSFVMYPGEKRMIQSDGSNFYSVLLAGGSRVFTATGTFVAPPGVSGYKVEAIGAGGGGGSGRRGAAASVRSGGSGGGGGARSTTLITSITPGTSITVTIGVGGGGTAITVDNTSGNNGTAGGNSSFGTYITVYGGGFGGGGDTGRVGGGGGGGTGGAGVNGQVGSGGNLGGKPQNNSSFGSTSSGFQNSVGGGGAASYCSSPFSGSAEWGGGAGGCIVSSDNAISSDGGSSIFGGPGGGGGGGVDSANTVTNGSAGGNISAYTIGGGGAGGVAGAAGTAGTNSTSNCGTGGGGGSGSKTATAGNGGAGGIPGGGGGGGGGSLNGYNSGAGGDGGRGEVRVYWW